MGANCSRAGMAASVLGLSHAPAIRDRGSPGTGGADVAVMAPEGPSAGGEYFGLLRVAMGSLDLGEGRDPRQSQSGRTGEERGKERGEKWEKRERKEKGR